MSAVDLWLLPVRPGVADDPATADLLSGEERAVIKALGFFDDRDRAATARVAARRELGRRLGVHPRLVPLRSGGRPEVAGGLLHVSWAHSGRWVALAVAGRPVGVDIELVPATLPVRALAEVGLHSMEEFVCFEAAGKATGRWVHGSWPSGTAIQLVPAPAGYLAAVAAPGDDWTPRLCQVPPGEGPSFDQTGDRIDRFC